MWDDNSDVDSARTDLFDIDSNRQSQKSTRKCQARLKAKWGTTECYAFNVAASSNFFLKFRGRIFYVKKDIWKKRMQPHKTKQKSLELVHCL